MFASRLFPTPSLFSPVVREMRLIADIFSMDFCVVTTRRFDDYCLLLLISFPENARGLRLKSGFIYDKVAIAGSIMIAV